MKTGPYLYVPVRISIASLRPWLATRKTSFRHSYTQAEYTVFSIVSQIAHDIDLNTLHALSSTCRQFRANLLQYRNRLVQQTLRCEKDRQSFEQNSTDALAGTQHIPGDQIYGGRRLTSGRVGTCARDMVGDCRNCGRIVCRVAAP